VSTSTPQAGSEEREDGEVPGLLAAEALCPAQRVHLLEQVELQPFALELGDALAEEQRSRSSRTASVSDLYRSAQSMAREESSETRQGIQDRLHATAESAEERKRSRTDAAWKAKKTQQRKAISLRAPSRRASRSATRRASRSSSLTHCFSSSRLRDLAQRVLPPRPGHDEGATTKFIYSSCKYVQLSQLDMFIDEGIPCR
jgi:hypothetical protein